MKEFEKINAGNVTLVKGAIKNKKALIILENEDIVGVEDTILEDVDICSLYDHDNLFIYRQRDVFYIGQLLKFYMKDKDHVVVIATTPQVVKLYSRLRSSGYKSTDGIWIKLENLIDKRNELQDQLNKEKMKEIKQEEEPKDDDIFSIFSKDPRDDKEKFEFTPSRKNKDCAADDSYRAKCDGDCENCSRRITDEDIKTVIEEFKKNHDGRMPLPPEIVVELLKKKLGTDDLSDTAKHRLEELEKFGEIFDFFHKLSK